MMRQELIKYVNSPMECTETERETMRQYLQSDIRYTMEAIDMMLDNAWLEIDNARFKPKKEKPSAKQSKPVVEAVEKEQACILCSETTERRKKTRVLCEDSDFSLDEMCAPSLEIAPLTQGISLCSAAVPPSHFTEDTGNKLLDALNTYLSSI